MIFPNDLRFLRPTAPLAYRAPGTVSCTSVTVISRFKYNFRHKSDFRPPH